MNQIVLGAYNNFHDYFELTKPRIGLLVLFTTFVGLYVASNANVSIEIVFFTLLGTGLASSASGTLNNYFDRDIDPLMARTRLRALAAGRVEPHKVLLLGVLLTLCSFLILVGFVNLLAGLLALFTIFFYVVVYTLWLKRCSSWCTEVGGVAGAMPPLIGWAAITGSLSPQAMLLFLLLFLWQPPHFWALALLRAGEYKNAGIPMLPVVEGEQATKRRMLAYTIALLPVSLTFCFINHVSVMFYLLFFMLNAVYLFKTMVFYRMPVSRKSSMNLFGFSIVYIFLMFGIIFLLFSLKN